MSTLKSDSYVVTDSFFGAPYIDADEDREAPTRHHYIHGGFTGTDTRFSLCFPPPDRYQGRLLQPLEGANAGHEDVYTGPLGVAIGGLDMVFRLGGFTVESNMGHIGDVMDPKAGTDPTIYAFRAAAESENAEHVPPLMAASAPTRANTTWLVDYLPVIEQSLADLIAWVEDGVDPGENSFEYRDGAIILPGTAAERGGIQPVVTVTVDGAQRAEVGVGQPVTATVHAQTPPGTGAIIAVRWDFDGSGSYPQSVKVDGTAAVVTESTTHSYSQPGTYFVTALVESHRDGDVAATSRRIPNLASARVVVR